MKRILGIIMFIMTLISIVISYNKEKSITKNILLEMSLAISIYFYFIM